MSKYKKILQKLSKCTYPYETTDTSEIDAIEFALSDKNNIFDVDLAYSGLQSKWSENSVPLLDDPRLAKIVKYPFTITGEKYIQAWWEKMIDSILKETGKIFWSGIGAIITLIVERIL